MAGLLSVIRRAEMTDNRPLWLENSDYSQAGPKPGRKPRFRPDQCGVGDEIPDQAEQDIFVVGLAEVVIDADFFRIALVLSAVREVIMMIGTFFSRLSRARCGSGRSRPCAAFRCRR